MTADLLESPCTQSWRTAVPPELRVPPSVPAAVVRVSWKKSLLARGLARSGLTAFAGSRLCPPSLDVRILAYHRVWDTGDEARFLFDAELVSASSEEFAWQMDHVRRNFDTITFRDLLAGLDGTQPLPKKPLIVTFDDGFEDNFTHAFPILKEAGVPATVFVATDYIGVDQTFWYDRLANLILASRRRHLALRWLAAPLPLAWGPERHRALKYVLSVLKRVPNSLRLEALQHIEDELDGEGLPDGTPQSRPMTWEMAREMSRAGIEFGSHTCSHPILANLTDDELEHELTVSRATIERELGREVQVLSYPVGGRTAFDARVQKAVEAAGYRLGVAYLPGMNHLARLEKFGLRRLRIERYVGRAEFQAMLHLPRWFA